MKLFEKVSKCRSENRNLNFVTSEVDSESLFTLRRNIFKRDSCKVEVVAAPGNTTWHFKKFQNISEFENVFQKVSKYFKKFENVSKSLKMFQKV